MPFPSPFDRDPVRPLPSSGPVFAPRFPAGLRGDLPLQGMTVLAVEDSRFACEALRLMCRKAGARLRRADLIETARAHLRVYRPDVVIVDLGLPDGRGESLIRDLVLSPRRPSVVLGTSGNPDGRAFALAAGADGFLEKPLESLAQFCRILRRLLPDIDIPFAPGIDDPIHPDPLALHDDLARAAAALRDNPGPAEQHYVTGFLRGLARHAQDTALEDAALDAQGGQDGPAMGLEALRRMVDHRLALQTAAFGNLPVDGA